MVVSFRFGPRHRAAADPCEGSAGQTDLRPGTWSLSDVAQNPGYAFVQADTADRGAVRAVVREQRPGAVVNSAAETHVDRSIDDPASFERTNVGAAFELLEAARLT